ncbi:ribonuclease Z [Synechococcus sp. CBW1006]|nr:ribonuclease Z [Synechococcus sp. CBW1006]CAK6691517.1 Ribonuclease Z [Synechococcus sp. CBW1107]
MQVTFLGTSSGVPTRARNVSAVALRLPQRSELWLFDCGEATQHQFLRSELRVSQLSRIFITHMHGDHVFGLPGLLASLGLAGSCSGVDLYGPDPLRDYLEGVLRTSSTRIGYPLRTHRVREAAQSGAVLLDDDDLCVRCTPLTHRVPAYAYRVDQKPRPGRFDVEKARALGIPPGPIYAELKAGRSIRLENGEHIDGASLCGPERPGCSVVYCTDTVFSEAAVELAKGADLLIHESTFSHGEADLAFARQHSTSTMAAQTALAAGVKRLALTHLSPRYMPGNPMTPDDLLAEARAIFPETVIARDFLTLDVAAPEPAADSNDQPQQTGAAKQAKTHKSSRSTAPLQG